jgi:hypothetical protein
MTSASVAHNVVPGSNLASEFDFDAFSSVGSAVAWDDGPLSSPAPPQPSLHALNVEDIEFDLDSGFGDFSSSVEKEALYATADVIVIDGGRFLPSDGDDGDSSDEFGEFINHEEAQRLLLCPTSAQTAVFGSSAEKVCIVYCECLIL